MILLSVEAAQRRIFKLVHPVPSESVPLARALGRVLARHVRSIELPSFDNSSVDGFAVRSADLQDARPDRRATLKIVGDIPAGTARALRLGPGQAARIMTGAKLPRGADAVVMLEETDWAHRLQNDRLAPAVRASAPVATGANVRLRGTDTRPGRIALRAGTRLRPQDVGMLAMLGQSKVQVYRRPLIAVLSSGNELAPAGDRLRPGRISDANSPTLAALATAAGCEVLSLGIAADSRKSIESHLAPASRARADLIITSAGVSVGALDLVREVIRDNGRLIFWRVNVRPGKPLAVGEYRGIPVIGLPGNPVSAFVGFELFVRPAIVRLSGQASTPRLRVRAELLEPVTSDGRESYLRAMLTYDAGVYRLRLTGHQGSGNLMSLVQANALLVVPAGVKSLAAGDQAEAWLL